MVLPSTWSWIRCTQLFYCSYRPYFSPCNHVTNPYCVSQPLDTSFPQRLTPSPSSAFIFITLWLPQGFLKSTNTHTPSIINRRDVQRHTRAHRYSQAVCMTCCLRKWISDWVMYRQRWTPCPPQTSHTQGDNYNQQRCRERNTGGGRGTTFLSWKMSKRKPGHSASTPAVCGVLPMLM